MNNDQLDFAWWEIDNQMRRRIEEHFQTEWLKLPLSGSNPSAFYHSAAYWRKHHHARMLTNGRIVFDTPEAKLEFQLTYG